MSKIKLTKGELKRQRDGLKQFRRYLPTLILKKQQLQSKILEARKHLEDRIKALGNRAEEIEGWIGVLADPAIDITKWITPIDMSVSTVNIAGATVPIFDRLNFNLPEYDLYMTPFWIDEAIKELRLFISLLAEIETIKRQVAILEKELRVTTQRVNLFEKVKIPESIQNIRKINIYLGDQMANAVGIGKVAKKKVEARNLDVVMAA